MSGAPVRATTRELDALPSAGSGEKSGYLTVTKTNEGDPRGDSARANELIPLGFKLAKAHGSNYRALS